MLRKATSGVVLALIVLCMTGTVDAVPTVVSPNAQASVEGNTSNGYPFNIFGNSSLRYQQVYSATDFSAVVGPYLITQIAFRPDAGSSPPDTYSVVLPDVQINLSTTAKVPDGLSATFASNVGADDTVVYARGPLALSTNFTGPVAGPKTFDVIITLSSPFLYNPANGNLLLDVRNYGGGPLFLHYFDAENSIDTVSRASTNGGTVNDAVGGIDSVGLVTQFNFVPVPEPASFALIGIGAIGMMVYGWRRRGRNAAHNRLEH